MTSRGGRIGTAFALAALLASPARAHDLPLDTAMTALVQVEPHELHVVLRVPLDLLRAVPFPIADYRYDLARAAPATQQALDALVRSIPIWEGDVRLVPSSAVTRLSLPSDRSFTDYDRAVAHVAAPLAPDTRIYVDQGFLDAHLTYPISSDRGVFAVQTRVAAELGDVVKLAVRWLPRDGSGRAAVITAADGRVRLNPTWYQAALGFVRLGVEHILSGLDHLLFLACLVIPIRRIRSILAVVTAFTVAHSFALIGSAYHLAPTGAWFPPFVETAIAASIVYMALENILWHSLRRRWVATALFGLVHGFGFSYGLQERLQFAGSQLLASLVAFNVGIELGQVLVLAAMLPALALFRRIVDARAGAIVLSALIAHTGWHWMLERWAVLSRVEWPRPDAASLPLLAKWAAGLIAVGAAAALAARWVARRGAPAPQPGGARERSSPA